MTEGWRREDLERYVLENMRYMFPYGARITCPVCGTELRDWQDHPSVLTNKLENHLVERHGIAVEPTSSS